MSDPRVHVSLRLSSAAVEYARGQARAESERSGVRVTPSQLLRRWLGLGLQAWMEGKR